MQHGEVAIDGDVAAHAGHRLRALGVPHAEDMSGPGRASPAGRRRALRRQHLTVDQPPQERLEVPTLGDGGGQPVPGLELGEVPLLGHPGVDVGRPVAGQHVVLQGPDLVLGPDGRVLGGELTLQRALGLQGQVLFEERRGPAREQGEEDPGRDRVRDQPHPAQAGALADQVVDQLLDR